MVNYRRAFPFEFVLMMGDNLNGIVTERTAAGLTRGVITSPL
jgi:hypothetical protein